MPPTATDPDLLLAALLSGDMPPGVYADQLKDRGQWAWPDVLRLLVDNPQYAAPRLLAALWYEETGQHDRARFVRTQCRLAEHPTHYHSQAVHGPETQVCHDCMVAGRDAPRCEYHTLVMLDRVLLEANYREWVTDATPPGARPVHCEYPVVGDNWDYRSALGWRFGTSTLWGRFGRGFMEAVTATAHDWLAHGDSIAAVQPVAKVTLITMPELRRVPDLIADVYQCYDLSTGQRTARFTIDRRHDDPAERYIIQRLLRQLWPHAHFTLPPAARGTPA